ncbi:unnamed protein product [Rangifer tarandus platyrhynchus]|uniref:Uncharacterized protein n=2 Tax=Rangifer tarandus platyrhynchus TaxID=3082113 RepID=A0AC59Y0J9_RANTA|nr:unnamed protein product [Rangifer tarandus platyrhynchus]
MCFKERAKQCQKKWRCCELKRGRRNLSIIGRGGVKGEERSWEEGPRSGESRGPGEPLFLPPSLQQYLHSIPSSPPSSGPPPIPHPTIRKHHQLPSHSCCHSPCLGETLLPAQTIPDR